ncbi:thiopeptide-type bacteriocin biosynthesis protein [Enterococcus sp. UD-01]|jgi:thiopeptide-type bacteriocin biosynthesis protein|uniref:lantibiotic dehydratase n=1 Tax=Enterococcus sp. UD-01 TaxID=3373911 RepID=UPI0038388DD2
MHYEVQDMFIYRKAVLPFGTIQILYQNLSSTEFINYVKSNYYDILYSLSPKLAKFLDNKDMDKEKVAMTLYKYISRCFSRTTPYALAASVGIGEFSGENNFYVDDNSDEVRIDVDGEWIFLFSKILEKDLFFDLYVKKNNTLISLKKNIINTWVTIENTKNLNKNNLILDKTKALSIVLSMTKEWVNVSELIEKLIVEYPNVEEVVFQNFLMELIESEIIISDIRCELLKPCILNNITKVIEKYSGNLKLEFIGKIAIEIRNLEKSKEVKFVEKIEEITSQMSAICKSEKYLNIISKSSASINIDKNVKKDIKDFARLLTKVTEQISKPLSSYKNIFLEKYGCNIGVPIFEALYDEEKLRDKDEIIIRDNDVYRRLLRKIARTSIEASIDIAFLDNKYDYQPHRIHKGFEISLYPIKKEMEMEYIISPLVGSDGISKIFGRFDSLFEETISKNSKTIIDNNNFETIDLKFFPKEKTLLNVMNTPNLSKKTLYYGASDSENTDKVDLNDIYIYLDESSIFHFVNSKTYKEVIFNVNSMINMNFAPQILKNIMTITSKNEVQIFDLFHILNCICMDIGFLPEIRYKQFIVSTRKLYIHKDLEMEHIINNYSECKKYLKEIIDSSFNSSKCFLENGDNRIIIDTTNDLGMKILYKEFKNNNFILISEVPFDEGDLMINDGTNRYVGEFVFQLIDYKYWEKGSNLKDYILQDKFCIESNKFVPYKKYVYYKIYCRSSNHELILKNNITNWMNELERNNLITGYFFIRYKDDQDHLRVRLILREDRDINDLVDVNSSYTNDLLCENIISDIQISTYEREIYRYGSPQILDKLEKLFCFESETLCSCIYFLSKHEKNSLYYYIVNYYLYLSGLHNRRQVQILENYKLKKVFRKEFNDFQNELLDFPKKDNLLLNKLISTFEKNDKEISAILKYIENSESSIDEKNSIFLSIFHMLHNRLIGIDRENEEKIMSFVSRAIRINYEKTK